MSLQEAALPPQSTTEAAVPARGRWKQVKKMRLLYLMMLLPVVHLFIFHYIPIYGIVIAFKDFSPGRGILDSPWNKFEHFRFLFSDFLFLRALKNTIIISLLKLVVGFPAPIVFALLLNEVRRALFKRIAQSISYLPHFMSWVILASMVGEVLSPQRGIVNYLVSLFGGQPINFLADPQLFVPLLIVTDIWKEVGWGAIIYLAAMSSVNPDLYEAAEVDGANRFSRALHITIPSILPIITILFILNLGQILNVGFDQILNLYNPMVYEVADVIDTYVYRKGLEQFEFDYAAAVGLFKNVVGIALILGANAIVRRHSEHGIW